MVQRSREHPVVAEQGNEGAWSNVRSDCSDGVQLVERGEGDWTR